MGSSTEAASKLGVAIDHVATTMQDFVWGVIDHVNEVIYRYACVAYKRRYGKLPGSTRTSRLRKKRRKMVMRWYEQEIARIKRKYLDNFENGVF